MSHALFGTDGIRAVAGEEPLTAATVARIAEAFGARLAESQGTRPLVLLGHDGRASADFLTAAIESGLAAAGCDFQETGLVTTPALAALVRDHGVQGGVMVSASHNPARDNGIKLFGARGEKVADAEERAIEAAVAGGATPHAARAFGRRRTGAGIRTGDYLERLVSRSGIARDALRGRRIAFDGAHGGGARLGPELLRLLGADVVEIGTHPDGTNINDGVGALHPHAVASAVVQRGCDLGIALDGDGDRVMLADEHGAVVDGDGVLAACAPDLQARGKLPGAAVVASVMSNLGLASALAAKGIGVDVVPVGDRHVVARLKERGLALGAEPSGHVIFGADNDFVGDGLYCALRVLELLGRTRKPLSELAAFTPFHQVLLNVPVKRREPLERVAAVDAARRAAESALGARGRVVLRYSGTEPLLRVMVEAAEGDAAQRLAQSIADAARASLT